MRSFLYKRKIIYIILIVVGIITVTGTTYAIFTTTTAQEGTNTIETLKCLELEFSNQKNVINLSNTYPMLDERGMKNTPYTFTLTNKCGTYVEYSVGLSINKDNTLEDKYVKTIFTVAENTGEPVLLTDRIEGEAYNNKKTYVFRNDGLENNASKDYKLILWIDESATKNQKGQSFIGNIIINTKPIKNEGQKTISVDLDGGNLLQELNEIYREGMKIKLPVPAKAGYYFDRWEVTSGDGTIDDNNYLIIGKENISLKAYYKEGIRVILELNRGSITQEFKDKYNQGDTITLANPTKERYKFIGWKITSGDGTLNGNVLTINTESVVIEATWKKQVTLTVDLNGGNTTQTFASAYYEGDILELADVTKTNSIFAGWEIINGSGKILKNHVINGSFENGNNGWNLLSEDIKIIEKQKDGFGQYMINNKNGDYWTAALSTNVPITKSHKLYYSFDSYTESKGNGSCYGQISFYYNEAHHFMSAIEQDNINVWERKSNIYVSPDIDNLQIAFVVVDTTSTDKTQNCYADNVLLIDLTESFGAGNEPTIAWCDSNLKYFNTYSLIFSDSNITIKAIWS